ncbi:MAG: hypothetical protein IJK52_13605 [Oscillospiraceae bacterium]|nr:hypothetical protein [Oscillospiraceae bacterium]
MKTEYTKRQLDAAASLYREQERECRKLDTEAEELLKEGEYVQRERVLKKANDERRVLDGMKAMAEAVGIPGDVLVRASGKKGA